MHVLRLPEVLAIAWSLTALAVLLTLGRFVIHWRRRRRLAWDDFFNGLAMGMHILFAARFFLLAFTGTWQVFGPTEYSTQLFTMGLIKESEIPPGNPSKNAKYNSANSLIFWCVVYSVKASFLALYWNIFEFSTKFRIAWFLSAVYMFLSFWVTFLWPFWLCGHPRYFPDKQPYCHIYAPKRVFPMFEAWCALDLIGDFFLIALPVAMLKPLLMKTSQKFELGIIFSLVVVNMVLTILRTVYSVKVDLSRFPDQNVLWFFLQVTIAVMVCALPCYRGILSRKRNASLPQRRMSSTGSSEFAEMWQRYLLSIGERPPEDTRREMEQSAISDSTVKQDISISAKATV